jgi:LysR substrate binding domain
MMNRVLTPGRTAAAACASRSRWPTGRAAASAWRRQIELPGPREPAPRRPVHLCDLQARKAASRTMDIRPQVARWSPSPAPRETLPPAQPGRASDRGRASLRRGPERRLRPHGGRPRAAPGTGVQRVADGQHLACIGGEMAGPAARAVQQLHPEIDVRVSAAMRLVDFAREDVDVAIRYGRGSYPGLLAELLLTNEVVPVCAPALLEGAYPLGRPQDLRHHALLHDDTATSDGAYPNWPMWLRAAGLEDIDPPRGPRFDLPGPGPGCRRGRARRRPGAEHRCRRGPRGRALGHALRGRRADAVRVLRRLPGSDGRATEGSGFRRWLRAEAGRDAAAPA